jgi:hypothetical protein
LWAFIPVLIAELVCCQKVSLVDGSLIVETTNLFSFKKNTYPLDEISIMRDYIFGFSMRVRDRTVLLNYCNYKKSDVTQLTARIVELQNAKSYGE